MRTPKIGTVMEDGSRYVGLSQKTGNMLFVLLPPAGQEVMNLKQSHAYLEELNLYRTQSPADWRLPEINELEVIFENIKKGLSGIFNEAGKLPAKQTEIIPFVGRASPGWYRAADHKGAWTSPSVSFKDGKKFHHLDVEPVSVLFIREGGRPDGLAVLQHHTTKAAKAVQAKVKKLSR